jgi:phage baseplate assembly protein W
VDGGQLYGRGMSFPPRIGQDGRIAWSEGESNIREAIRVILLTEEKERVRLPEFGGGLQRFLFEPNTVATQSQIQDRITKALQQWEPRILVRQVIVQQDAADQQKAIATIAYQLVATQVQQTISLSVQLSS